MTKKPLHVNQQTKKRSKNHNISIVQQSQKYLQVLAHMPKKILKHESKLYEALIKRCSNHEFQQTHVNIQGKC